MNFKQNNLSAEKSPYLLQHQNNPVWWQPWAQEVLDHAKETNRPLLISIGYSACHWCHVMEHECFEDEEVAALMNEYFINIKVDREERPDVDAVYMKAVHLMKKQGGWPLNVICLPNGKPFFGGTYFPKKQWMEILQKVNELLQDEPHKVREYTQQLTQQMNHIETIIAQEKEEIPSISPESMQFLFQRFDQNWGGIGQAPKFPVPVLWEFLLTAGHLTSNEKFLQQTQLTLNRMAWGGMYDAVGGGFSRYSVDPYWKVPHFEKMLYDNAQLIKLYSMAYQKFKLPLYEEVVAQTIEWLTDELMHPEGGFYSALDADSEGVEGKYYVWKTDELKTILKEDFPLFAKYYKVDDFGKWEESNILMRLVSDEDFCKANQLDLSNFIEQKKQWIQTLKNIRNQRIKPGLDDKIITSWNAQLIIGLVKASEVFGNENYLQLAKNCLSFLWKNHWDGQRLLRTFGSDISGFLDDYAFMIQAFIQLYQSTADEKYIQLAGELIAITNQNFLNRKNEMYYYTSLKEKPLISPTIETLDSVIPSSNAVMAENLLLYGKIMHGEDSVKQAEQMLKNVLPQIDKFPESYALWLKIQLFFTHPFYEIAISGNDATATHQLFAEHFIPNAIWVSQSEKNENAPLLKNRIQEQSNIFVCKGQQCLLPTDDVQEVLEILSPKSNPSENESSDNQ